MNPTHPAVDRIPAIDPAALPADLPSPCYLVDEAALEANLRVLASVAADSGATIVLALKGFSMWPLFPLMRPHLAGCCASGLWEARLAHEEFGGELLTYSPAYTEADVDGLLPITDHLDFNSTGQWLRHRARVMAHPRFKSGELQCGLRINPECSTGEVPIYDPCVAGSRLGITADQLRGFDGRGISGLHFHTLCEQGAGDLEQTLAAVGERFGDWLARPEIRWLNMGGGHWITKAGYDRALLARLVRRTAEQYGLKIYLEPGEAAVIHTGVLVATVIDVVWNAMPVAILDVSATAHMPDVLEMPYRPQVFMADGTEAGDGRHGGELHRLGGPTCLASDVIGDFSFPRRLEPGDRLIFDDMAHYTMVKTTMFNGVRHPDIGSIDTRTGAWRLHRRFDYEDYRSRLG